jgi:hypothetical protein
MSTIFVFEIGSLVQHNNKVFTIVSYDKPYTQFAGHYTIQSLETGQVLKAFKHELRQYEPVDKLP